MDNRAVAARRHNDQATSLIFEAGRHRHQRDELIRALRLDNPTLWTYTALANAVGVSKELIAVIVKESGKKE